MRFGVRRGYDSVVDAYDEYAAAEIFAHSEGFEGLVRVQACDSKVKWFQVKFGDGYYRAEEVPPP